MEIKFGQVLLIGICCGFLTCCTAQVDIQRKLCNGVPANTYIRNVTDCRVWIRCNGPDSSPVSGFCPNPSYFSEELQKCTSQEAANCFTCPNTPSTTLHSVANSCSRFIRCNNGVAWEMTCGVGMGFNPETDKCEPGFYRTCTAETTVPITTPSTDSASADPSEKTPSEATSTATDEPSEETPSETPSTATNEPSEEIPSDAPSTTILVTPWNPIASIVADAPGEETPSGVVSTATVEPVPELSILDWGGPEV